MPKLSQVCRYVRSKNAGPFWITHDLFFVDDAAFQTFSASSALSTESLANLFVVPPSALKRFLVPDLRVLKISYPRSTPQGSVTERDMHGGQQFVRLLDVEL